MPRHHTNRQCFHGVSAFRLPVLLDQEGTWIWFIPRNWASPQSSNPSCAVGVTTPALIGATLLAHVRIYRRLARESKGSLVNMQPLTP